MTELAACRVENPASELIDEMGIRAHARFRILQDSGRTFTG
jgi:hypothetical protein